MSTAIDMLAVADAVATQFADLTIGTAVTGGTAMRGATAREPNNIPATPYVVVNLPSSNEVNDGSYGRIDIAHDFPVDFLFSQASGDHPRITESMLAWLGVLIWALEAANKLGITSVVMKSRIVAYEPAIIAYGGQDYLAWNLTVRVWTESTYQPVPA